MADKTKMQELTQKFDEVMELAQKLDGVQELTQRLDEMIELARKLHEVQELAQKLNDWAKSELKGSPKQQLLLQWLLSRGAYTETRVNRRLVVGTTGYLGADDIRQAVIDALAPVIGNLPNPIEGWARFSPWPRFGDWPRDGYWALGMGRPPRIDKISPEIPIPQKGPKTPPI